MWSVNHPPKHEARNKNSLFLIDGVVLVLLTRRILDAIPALNRIEPLPPPRPRSLMLAALACCGQSKATLLVLVKHPQPHREGRHHKVHKFRLRAEKVWPLLIHLARKLPQLVVELYAELFDWLRGLSVLELEEAVESGNHARGDVVAPDAGDGALVGVGGLEFEAVAGIR